MLLILPPGSANVASNQPHQLPCHMKYTDAMSEPGMCGSHEDELRKAELSDPTKPLERWRLDDAPEHVLELAGIELDEIVERVPDPLWLNIQRMDPANSLFAIGSKREQ
jgi:hypothetical protein